jgi:AcrR family transcriptional regulator
MGHIERKQREKETVRKRIIDAAINIAASEGWDSVTVRKIAGAVEYTPPIIYEHFENKGDLFKELAFIGFQIMNKGFDKAMKNGSDSRGILMLMSSSYLEFANKHKELYQLMFFRMEKPEFNKEVSSIIQKIKNLFNDLCNDKDMADELLFNWMCLQNGYIYNFMKMELPPDLKKTHKELYLNAIERFLKGI